MDHAPQGCMSCSGGCGRQMGLAQMYETQLSAHGLSSAQVLLTHADLADRERYLPCALDAADLAGPPRSARHQQGNTVVTDEIKFGDNDTSAPLWPTSLRPTCWSS